MSSQTTKLSISPREPEGSRATRRLRRSGRVPGILYGGDAEPMAFSVDARELRHALAARGAVLEVSDGGTGTPAILKAAQHHPVRGETLHVDLLRVKLDVAIAAVVPLELTGGDESPGVRDGGVLEQITRELNIEALPTAIPESISHDVSRMEINDTVTLAELIPPAGITLLDDLEETVIATLTPPRLEAEADEIEAETGIVGEGAGEAEGSPADADADEVPADAGGTGGE
ncbi:MAG TPA: 50S ribosomal protein L25 [Solirubrobacteraceae bacterium]|nr:50S ribosomal protein L25 [Solirubrobacteraceae bacterium]